jgi:hypothetical protein
MANRRPTDSIAPTLTELAETIASGLIGDLEAGRTQACGIDQVRAAIADRRQPQTLDRFDQERLETLVLRKLINKAT